MHRQRHLCLTNLWFDQAKGAITTSVEYIDCTRFYIVEYKEIFVPKKLHLLDGFFFSHRNEIELLAAYDRWHFFKVAFGNKFDIRSSFRCRFAISTPMFALIFEAGNLPGKF